MSNARRLESVVDKGLRQKINAFQGRECFLGLSEGAFLDMQEARTLAAFGQAFHLSARKSGTLWDGWPVATPSRHCSKYGLCSNS